MRDNTRSQPSQQAHPIENVVFDFDGTLAELTIDFQDMRAQVVNVITPFFSQRPTPDSTPVLEWLEHLAEQMKSNGSRENAQEMMRRAHEKIVQIETKAARRGRLFPQTRGLLKSLAEKGVGLCVITRNCHPAVKTVFPDLPDYVACVLAREHVNRVKPHPEHLNLALATLQAKPESALMVGDHPLDIETGKRAGVRTAAVASGRIPLHELKAHDPDWAAEDAGALFSLLDQEERFATTPTLS